VAFGPPRAIFAVSSPDPAGVLSTSSPHGSDPGGTPLCVLPVSSKRLPCNRTHERNVSAPLLGFCAPTARDETGYPYVPRRSPRSSWHRPPSGFLTLSTVFSTRSHARLSNIDSLAKAGASPQRSWGSLGPRLLGGIFRFRQGSRAQVPSLRFSPPSRRARFSVPSLRALRSTSRFRSDQGTNALPLRALQGLDRKRVGFHAVANHASRPS
jgi:hypothetical protein